MKKITHKSALPLYAAAVVWIVYALLFPLYQPLHFVIVAVVSLVVGLVAAKFCPDVVELVPEEEEKPTGDPELDAMLRQGKEALARMRRLDDDIEDAAISRKIRRLEEVSGKIFAQVKAEPDKLPQIRKFMNYYLPTTLKLLNAYARMDRQQVDGENIRSTMARVESIMDTVVQAFERQLDSLFGAEAMDISTDITVLENMLAREGLADDPFRRSDKNKDDDASGGISLEL